ncbi:MAG: putative glycosyltransferase, exosortase G system-associated [Lachnospiraceae bacterium]|nr:putative glycosyltransferase, exosortase G system-associated [Lachnospiraceae bacterium]
MMGRLTNLFLFWSAWIILPLLIEIIPAIGNFMLLVWKKLHVRKLGQEELQFKPTITLIIPVYNSEATLYHCIKSINDSTYPTELIEVLLVDNGSKDNSFAEFQRAQLTFAELSMWWISSQQGKSKALNKAIFNSNGKYVMNIDSDGILEETALYNMVAQFERDGSVDCMTGVILTQPDLVEETEHFFLRQFRRLEFMEYAQAFLAGRNFESQFNSIYTLSGAFSAFRKSVLLKTYLYNTNTICEDTHLSFQIKSVLNKKIALCPDALFMVDPIDDLNKFYTQRQRWQIGELEVSNMFLKNKMRQPIWKFFTDPTMRLLMMDHTFAFPRLIWYFALAAIGCINYDFGKTLIATALIYGLYVLVGLLYYFNILTFLENFKDIRRYYAGKVGYLLLLPLYNLYAFFVRIAGIINSIARKSSWKTKTWTAEMEECEDTLKFDWNWVCEMRRKLIDLLEE